jgi:Enolase C-terminal domain-like
LSIWPAGYIAEGFKAAKLKVGFGITEDVSVTRAVRQAVGLDSEIRAFDSARRRRMRIGLASAIRALDFIQPDTCAAGGLSECKKIADMAVAFGTLYNPHVWGTGVALAASLQLFAVLPALHLLTRFSSLTAPSIRSARPCWRLRLSTIAGLFAYPKGQASESKLIATPSSGSLHITHPALGVLDCQALEAHGGR